MEAGKKSPRVAHVLLSLAHGGLERCVVEWTRVRDGRLPGETCVICLDELGALEGELPEGSVRLASADRGRWPWDRGAVRRLRGMLHDQGIDVVHSHNVAAQQYAGLAAQGVCRHVHTEHGSNVYLGGFRNRLRLLLLRVTTDAWVAVSTDTCAAMEDGAGVACRCVENGISVNPQGLSASDARHVLGIGEGPVIGVVGRLSREKGVDRLLEAMGSGAMSGVTLAVVGDGGERTALEAQSRVLGVDAHFLGMRGDARRSLTGFDLLVIPSRSEGLPMVLLEALAEGVPVVVTHAGECQMVVEGGCGAMLPDDTAQWPARLCEEVEKSRRGDLADQVARGRHRVATRYNVERTVDAYEAIYKEVVVCSRS